MGFVFRRRAGSGGREGRGQREQFRRARGPARCVAAIPWLRTLAMQPDQIVAEWSLMMPALAADVADCPPDRKADLRQALEDVGAACSHRETAKSIIQVRDQLILPVPPLPVAP